MLLRTNSSETSFDENIRQFKSRLHVRGYPDSLVNKVLSEVKFEERKSALQQKEKTHKKILPFVTQHHPAVPNLEHLDEKMTLNTESEIYKSLPLSRTKEVNRSKIYSFERRKYTFAHNRSRAGLSQFFLISEKKNNNKTVKSLKKETQ